MLEDEGVLSHLEIGEFHMGLVPFDTDLLSLEMDSVFKQVGECFLFSPQQFALLTFLFSNEMCVSILCAYVSL